jgi:hypothetical protein
VRSLVALVALPLANATAQPVTNGEPDSGDAAVVALVNDKYQVVCTAAVIGPHTAITAAHCLGRAPTTLRVFFGSSIAYGGLYLQVSDARAHPAFNPGGGDIALLTLRQRAPVTPLALEPALAASLVGTTIRVVGFGLTAGGAIDDAGDKRAGTARIAAVQPEELTAVPGPSLTCLGDSGGPALLPAGTIAGVVSRVDAQCIDHAVYTRADTAQDALIRPYLAETAPGAAADGEPCFYADHCAAGLECVGDSETICAPESGCGCRGGKSPSLLLLALVLLYCRNGSRYSVVTGRLTKSV